MAVAALIGKIAAELLAAALFGSDGCAVNDVLGPAGSRFDPVDQFASVFAPIGIFLRVEQNVASEFERNDLIHVFHVRPDILEISDPYVVVHGVFHEPGPSAFTNYFVGGNVALTDADEFIKEHDGLDDICGIGTHALAGRERAVAGEAAERPGRIFLVAGLEILYQGGGAANSGAQIF